MSVPFVEKRFEATMADGKNVTLTASGNDLGAVFRTLDGQPVLRDPAGGWFAEAPASAAGPATRSRSGRRSNTSPGDPALRATVSVAGDLPKPRWQSRRDNQRLLNLREEQSPGAPKAPPQRETIGDYFGLCLLVDFPDAQATIERQEIDAFCNLSGYSGFGNNGSVFDYFHDISMGRLRYRTLVLPCYTAHEPRSHYTDASIPFGQRARELITEALAFHRNAGVDFSGLTADAQRAVYAVNIFYAGGAGEWGKGLWPHASRLNTPIALAPGKNALDYQISAIGDQLTLGVYCHENGHMLCDFPDLYAYPQTRQKVGVGRYCLMCLGARADEANPTQVCAYLKFRAGWGKATDIVAGVNTLSASEPNRFLIHRKSATEYFIIERRRNAGRDKTLASSGLAIWHIDELGSNTDPEAAPEGHQHAECVMLQADGQSELELGIDDGDASDLFGAEPNPVFTQGTALSSDWWDGTPSGLQIHSVESSNGDLRFVATLA